MTELKRMDFIAQANYMAFGQQRYRGTSVVCWCSGFLGVPPASLGSGCPDLLFTPSHHPLRHPTPNTDTQAKGLGLLGFFQFLEYPALSYLGPIPVAFLPSSCSLKCHSWVTWQRKHHHLRAFPEPLMQSRARKTFFLLAAECVR